MNQYLLDMYSRLGLFVSFLLLHQFQFLEILIAIIYTKARREQESNPTLQNNLDLSSFDVQQEEKNIHWAKPQEHRN